MKDKSLKILLRVIAVNLTLQTINEIELFPTAYAKSDDYVRAIRNHDSNMSGAIDSAKRKIMDHIIIFSN